MKKFVISILVVAIAFLIVACKQEPEPHVHSWGEGKDNGNGRIVYECSGCSETRFEYKTYEMGSTGPAGGFVFYDVDADNETGNADGLKSSECGWRYMEISVNYLKNPTPSYNTLYSEKNPADAGSYNGNYLITDEFVTEDKIGTGKKNTEKFIAALESGYLYSSGNKTATKQTTANCPFYIASVSEEGGKNDWFIPSVGELIAADTANFPFVNKSYGVWSSTRTKTDTTYNHTMYNGASSTQHQGPNSYWYIVREF